MSLSLKDESFLDNHNPSVLHQMTISSLQSTSRYITQSSAAAVTLRGRLSIPHNTVSCSKPKLREL